MGKNKAEQTRSAGRRPTTGRRWAADLGSVTGLGGALQRTAGLCAQASQNRIAARCACVVVVAHALHGVPVAAVQVGGGFAVGGESRKDQVSVHGHADLRTVRGGGSAFVEAVRHGVVVVTGMQVHMAAAIVKRRNCVSAQDGVDARGAIEAVGA